MKHHRPCPHPECKATLVFDEQVHGSAQCICRAIVVLIEWENNRPFVSLVNTEKSK